MLELAVLRKEVLAGRGPDAGVEDPFFDLIVSIAFTGGNLAAHVEQVKACLDKVMELLNENIGNLDFWERADLVSNLKGHIKRQLVLSKVPQLRDLREQLAVEIVALARRRSAEVLGISRMADSSEPA